MSLLDGIKRRWHSRGHGIHSPFAYRFVTHVLRAPSKRYAYYAYSELPDSGYDTWPRLLFRLMCEFRPERVLVSPQLSEAERMAIAMADSRPPIVEMDGQEPLLIFETPQGPVSLFSGPDKTERPHDGMTFSNGCECIAVQYPHLPRQHFEINFAHRPATS